MYDIDPKFLNHDGSLNTEAACAAGRRAQARTAAEGAREFKGLAKRLVDHAISTAWILFSSRKA